MKIAILGTRGIPNNYGGFEQFAEYLSVGLVQRGYEVTVYNSHTHAYQENEFNGVKIEHIYDPENRVGTAGQFIYDFLSILDTRKKDFDIILQLGYTSSSIFFDLHPRSTIIITNMDGLEWKRTKYSKKVQKFLQWAESLAVKKSNHLVSDSIGIRNYLFRKYQATSTYIPYGSNLFEDENVDVLLEYGLVAYGYNMLIARLEPENSIEMILDGVVESNTKTLFLIVGKYDTKFGEYLKIKFKENENIKFIGGIYDIIVLNNLRHFSNLYFHGHTVGGTNPSLLEAMASGALICANDNEFNSTILGDDAFYFLSIEDVAKVLAGVSKDEHSIKIENNREKITKLYTWENIVDDYEKLFVNLMKERESENYTKSN